MVSAVRLAMRLFFMLLAPSGVILCAPYKAETDGMPLLAFGVLCLWAGLRHGLDVHELAALQAFRLLTVGLRGA